MPGPADFSCMVMSCSFQGRGSRLRERRSRDVRVDGNLTPPRAAIVTLEDTNTTVLNPAARTLRCSDPLGHESAQERKNTYAEKISPNNITSEARKSHMPNLPLFNPV